MKPKTNSEIVLYQAADGKTRLEVQFQGETAWLSLNQMAELFQRDKYGMKVRLAGTAGGAIDADEGIAIIDC